MAERAQEPYAAVALNTPLERLFHYRVPAALAGVLARGARVRVPFGRREMIGYCVGFTDTPDVEETRLKDIIALVDREPLLDDRMLELTQWLAGYYCCSWGEALDAVLPAAVRRKKAASTVLLAEAAQTPAELRARAEAAAARAPRQARLLQALAATEGEIAARDLVRLAECDYAVLKTLARAGSLRLRRVQAADDDPSLRFQVAQAAPPNPTPDQAAAIVTLEETLAREGFAVILLHGVTGSGKTELYLQALERVVRRGKQGIVLVPEIALTPQTIARFRARFARVCVLHSEMSDRGRRREWQAIRAGRADVVIGARSAVFAPVPRLGLLVVDEEHEPSFKQQSVPRYHARDVGIWRARHEGALVLLGSATPSLESFQNARAGKYRLVELPRRVGNRPLPPVAVLDLTKEVFRRGGTPLLSRALKEAIAERLDRNEQVIIFLNRRGFHTHVTCARCGFVLQCDHCDVSLIYHRTRNRACCHYCGRETEPPQSCPVCNAPGLKYRGAGTQRVEEEIARAFGQERIARMDSDSMRGWAKYEKTLSDFRDGKTQILLGTQMVAKGLDFPNVTLVGVVNADTSLNLPDFRAAERTLQLLTQVAGRAGRSELGGRVIIQTFSADHACIHFARTHDYRGFAEAELADRRAFGYPPFGRLARLIIEGTDKAAVAERALAVTAAAARAVTGADVQILGPVEAPIARIKQRHRRHTIIKARKVSLLHQALRAVERKRIKGTQVIIDVDPVALL